MEMRVSVCITVLNEEKSIVPLLESLLNGSRKPDEIVIVDGGSDDKTVEVIKKFKKSNKILKLFAKKGSIASGRNESIKRSSGEIVVLTDAGCTADKNWVKEITKPFGDKKVGMVAGFYMMPIKNNFQKAASVFLGVPPERFNPKSFLPSARSVAFRKNVWEKVGGFDENLSMAGEDTKFFFEVVTRGIKIVRVKKAVVIWDELKTLTFYGAIKKFYFYARGDAQAGIWWHPSKRMSSHNIKIVSIYMRYLIGLLILGGILIFQLNLLVLIVFISVYLYYSMWKWLDEVRDWKSRFWLPIVQICSDIAVMLGFAAGTIK